MEMNDYLDFVEGLAKCQKDQVFFNSGPEHAAIVFSQMFKTAQKDLKIFAGDLSGEISNRDIYLKYLEFFLNKPDTKVEILLQSQEYVGKSFVFMVLNKFRNKVHLKVSPVEVQLKSQPESEIHFTVADNRMLRIEVDTNKYIAECNFNNPEKAGKLTWLFNNLFNSEDAVAVNW